MGFFSYYNYILDQEDALRIFVIKGGPGVGKSTFMKKIAERMLELGYDAEFMHCSSDNNSLDGVVIPAVRVALIDGTAPHIVDPKNPGAVDEIIHLGDYWDEEGMRRHRDEILKTNKQVGRLFTRAYKYIKAAAFIQEDMAEIYGRAVNKAAVNRAAAELIKNLFGDIPIASEEGRQRHLFASAISPKGLVNYLDSLLTTDRVYVVQGQLGTGTERLLEKVREAAVERGFKVESYYCALFPTKLEHLVIPGISTSLTTFNRYHSADILGYEVIDLDEFVDQRVMAGDAGVIAYNRMRFDELLEEAVSTIAKAKSLHDHLETYYIPNMDFGAVKSRWEEVTERILGYAGICSS